MAEVVGMIGMTEEEAAEKHDYDVVLACRAFPNPDPSVYTAQHFFENRDYFVYFSKEDLTKCAPYLYDAVFEIMRENPPRANELFEDFEQFFGEFDPDTFLPKQLRETRSYLLNWSNSLK